MGDPDVLQVRTLKESRARRFDPRQRHGQLHGATGRRVSWGDEHKHTIYHLPVDDDDPDPRVTRYLTRAEMEYGLPVSSHLAYSLDKDKRWEGVEALLNDIEAAVTVMPVAHVHERGGHTAVVPRPRLTADRSMSLCVSVPTRGALIARTAHEVSWNAKLKLVARSTVFMSPPAWFGPEDWARALEPHPRKRPLHQFQPLWQVPQSAPPGIDTSLVAPLNMAVGIAQSLASPANLYQRGHTATEAVRGTRRHGDRCWYPEGGQTSGLRVDLGRVCHVTHVTTQGRAPETFPFPPRSYDSCENQKWQIAGRRFAGPGFLRVADPDTDWVTRLAIYARHSFGPWDLVATVECNTDGHTVVAHQLAQGAGVKCRWLQFVPLSTHGRPALSVTVYGPKSAADCPARAPGSRFHDSTVQQSVGASGGCEGPCMQYVITGGVLNLGRAFAGRSPEEQTEGWRAARVSDLTRQSLYHRSHSRRFYWGDDGKHGARNHRKARWLREAVEAREIALGHLPGDRLDADGDDPRNVEHEWLQERPAAFEDFLRKTAPRRDQGINAFEPCVDENAGHYDMAPPLPQACRVPSSSASDGSSTFSFVHVDQVDDVPGMDPDAHHTTFDGGVHDIAENHSRPASLLRSLWALR
mmetsp:Transcript_6459/g.18772  ORF Transcript_6459/g.18772 Transcript_6459/m.18772 type:complete len:638 (-) Transcript_6459:188-2101(-)